MVFRYLCILVFWTKVASALEGLVDTEQLAHTLISPGVCECPELHRLLFATLDSICSSHSWNEVGPQYEGGFVLELLKSLHSSILDIH